MLDLNLFNDFSYKDFNQFLKAEDVVECKLYRYTNINGLKVKEMEAFTVKNSLFKDFYFINRNNKYVNVYINQCTTNDSVFTEIYLDHRDDEKARKLFNDYYTYNMNKLNTKLNLFIKKMQLLNNDIKEM